MSSHHHQPPPCDRGLALIETLALPAGAAILAATLLSVAIWPQIGRHLRCESESTKAGFTTEGVESKEAPLQPPEEHLLHTTEREELEAMVYAIATAALEAEWRGCTGVKLWRGRRVLGGSLARDGGVTRFHLSEDNHGITFWTRNAFGPGQESRRTRTTYRSSWEGSDAFVSHTLHRQSGHPVGAPRDETLTRLRDDTRFWLKVLSH